MSAGTVQPVENTSPQTQETRVVEFTYRPVGRWVGAPVRIRMKGFCGEHIIERVDRKRTFYELSLLEPIAVQTPRPVGIAVDAGANIGNHSVYLAAVLGARVLAVEPSQREADILRWNVAENSLSDRIRVFQCAAGAEAGEVVLKDVLFGPTASHVVGGPGEKGTQVPLRTIDDMIAETGWADPVSIIKIDVDGYERQVLEGARGTIEKHKPLITAETLDDDLREWIVDYLTPWGYSRVGPYCGTPTHIFGPRLKSKLVADLQCNLWKTVTRGAHVRALRKLSG